MAGMRVLCLGNGDAFSALRYSSCLAVEAEGAWLLIDCPHPIRKVLRESGAAAGVALDVGDFDAVVLTHLHADHASGLEGFLYYNHVALGRRSTVACHPEVQADLVDYQLRATAGRPREGSTDAAPLDDLVTFLPLSEDAPVQRGPFAISCRRTLHPVPTFALHLQAGNRTFAYSADTSFDPELIAWLAADADLVLHETNHGIHTPYARLASLPADLRRRMRLIHYPDDFDVSASVIEPIEQGRLYAI